MFHKNYHKGETYRHTAARENDISMALNQMCGFRLNGQSASSSGIVRISCYNSTSGKLPSGSAVTFSESASLCGDSVPVEKCSDDQKPWAVLENSLEPNKIGSAIVAGCAIVNVSGSALDYIVPDTQNPGTFKFSDTGTARVLFSGDSKCIVLLGVGTNDSYDGPFAVSFDSESGNLKISSGYINCNGTFSSVPAVELTPQTGTLCAYSEIGEDGVWSAPVVKFSEPDKYNYPVGSCKVNGNSVSFCCYRVPVAFIIDAAECPMSAKADEENQ